MGKFEEELIFPDISRDCLFYAKYIDDTFLVYTVDVKLKEFLKK